MTTNSSSAARQAQQALGIRLRELRKDAELTARHLAATLGRHYTWVSKVENGVQAPADHDIREWCRICSAPDQVADLVATLRSVESAYLEFRQQSRAGLKRVLGAHTMQRYQATNVFRIYEHNVIPGLMQTADYSAAMLSFWVGFLGTTDDIADAVAVRAERQQVLTQRDKRFAVLLEEQALRTWFGTAETQAGQLARLLELASTPTVSLGIVPLLTERMAVSSAGFWIFDDTLVALETPTASIEVTRPQEIRLYRRMFDALATSAVHGRAARDLIVAARNELDRRDPQEPVP